MTSPNIEQLLRESKWKEYFMPYDTSIKPYYPTISTDMNTGQSTLKYSCGGISHTIALPAELSPIFKDKEYTHEYNFSIDREDWFANTNSGMVISTKGIGEWMPKIKKVIYNPPATIVYWGDNTKTIVKCRDVDEFSEEYGLAMAIAKRYFEKRSKFVRAVKSATKQYETLEDIAIKSDGDIISRIFGKRKGEQ